MTSQGNGRRGARTTRRRASRWTLLLVAAAVVAALSPVAWLLQRPADAVGLPLADALEATALADEADASPAPETSRAPASATPVPVPSSRVVERQVGGQVAARDASPTALPQPGPAPTRLQVPSLGIDAAVDAVGVEEDGSMVVPAEVDRVGWYRFGPEAGAAQGNTVIAGHVDTIAQGPGALFELRTVEVGAEVLVTDEAGTPHRYRVVGREKIEKPSLPVERDLRSDRRAPPGGHHVRRGVPAGLPPVR